MKIPRISPPSLKGTRERKSVCVCTPNVMFVQSFFSCTSHIWNKYWTFLSLSIPSITPKILKWGKPQCFLCLTGLAQDIRSVLAFSYIQLTTLLMHQEVTERERERELLYNKVVNLILDWGWCWNTIGRKKFYTFYMAS